MFQVGETRFYCVTCLADMKKLVNPEQASIVFFGSNASWETIPDFEAFKNLARKRDGMEQYTRYANQMDVERSVDAVLARTPPGVRPVNAEDLVTLARNTLKRVAVAYSFAVEKGADPKELLRHCSLEAKDTLNKLDAPPELPKSKI